MQLHHTEYLLQVGSFAGSTDWTQTHAEVVAAITAVCWPAKEKGFYLREGSVGRKRGEGNGVTPIKDAFCLHLERNGWKLEQRMDLATLKQPGELDAVKVLSNGSAIAAEWETGNISSSHRAVNKMALGLLQQKLVAGILVLPTRKLYKFLTDRIGNYEELSPYFPMWKALPIKNGVLAILAVEHDGTKPGIPRIEKGTDGRALV